MIKLALYQAISYPVDNYPLFFGCHFHLPTERFLGMPSEQRIGIGGGGRGAPNMN